MSETRSHGADEPMLNSSRRRNFWSTAVLLAALVLSAVAAAPSTEPYRPHPDRQLVVLERIDPSKPTTLQVNYVAPANDQLTDRRIALGFVGVATDAAGKVVAGTGSIVLGTESTPAPVVWAQPGLKFQRCLPDPVVCRSGTFAGAAAQLKEGGGDEALTNRVYVWLIGERVRISIVDGADEWVARHVDPTSVLNEVHSYQSLSAGVQYQGVGAEAFIAAAHETKSPYTLGIGVPPCTPGLPFSSVGAGFWSLFGGTTTPRAVCPANGGNAPTAVAYEPTEWLFEGAGAGSTLFTGRYRLVVLDLADVDRQLQRTS